jgi:hypothetical protein
LGFQLNIEPRPPAAASFETIRGGSDEKSDGFEYQPRIEASGEESDGFEYQPPQMVGFSSKSVLDGSKYPDSPRNLASYVRGSWEGGER